MSKATADDQWNERCPVCDNFWDENDRHHPDYDPTPQEQWEVTEGWFPPKANDRDEHNPEGTCQ